MKNFRKFIATTIKEYLNENMIFNHNENYGKFELILNDEIIAETHYSINNSDEVFNKKYVALYALETNENHRGKGYMSKLLNYIFTFVKNDLHIKFILLDVEKHNANAIKLYNKNGFIIYNDDKKDKYITMVKEL
jgi:ribosomal protein S18 acetylase RimI-like enzyme